MRKTKSAVWRQHGLVDYKFQDVDLDAFVQDDRKWQWRLFRAAYAARVWLHLVLDLWTVFGLMKEPDIPRQLVVIQAISSVAGILIIIGYRHQAKLRFQQGDLSDTFSDNNARFYAATHDFRIYCLFMMIYTSLGKSVKRLMNLRAEFLDWRTLIFTQTPQLYVLLGYAKLIRYSKVIVYIKVVLLLFRVVKLCIMLALFPFVRCAIMALTKSTNTGVLAYCSLETEKVINEIVKGRTIQVQQTPQAQLAAVATKT